MEALLGLSRLFWCWRRGNLQPGDGSLASSRGFANGLLCCLGLPTCPLWAPFPSAIKQLALIFSDSK